MVDLPSTFIAAVVSVHGRKGEEWLSSLDELIDHCKRKWHFRLLPARNLSFNFVAPILFEDGLKAILKLGLAGRGIDSEIAALQAFKGQGICRLIDSEPQKGIMLLECIEPGEPLNIIQDDVLATSLASALVNDLLQVKSLISYPFQTADDWYNDLLRLQKRFGHREMPGFLFNKAIQAYRSIRTDPQQQRLLHGDLHQGNILSAGNNNWKAIDPKGLIAETGCELIPFLMNNLEGRDINQTVSHRVKAFSKELPVDEVRIAKWGIFRSVLSVYWKIEDNLPVTNKDLMVCECFYHMSSRS
jgi:streptomycin 6-kinase